jgi:hypothetical protein
MLKTMAHDLRAVLQLFEAAAAPSPELFRELAVKAIKRVGDGVRAMKLGSVVSYDPQARIDADDRAIHGTFFLRFKHERINPSHLPGINFYWDLAKERGTVGTSNLVWGNLKSLDKLPLAEVGPAMFQAADAIIADLKRQLGQKDTSREAWSVVTLGTDHAYATEVETFPSKAKATAAAKDRGNCYVVKGTQMWNEPLGQVEEHDRIAPSTFFPSVARLEGGPAPGDEPWAGSEPDDGKRLLKAVEAFQKYAARFDAATPETCASSLSGVLQSLAAVAREADFDETAQALMKARVKAQLGT